MEPHINDLVYEKQEMIEFEPVYVQQFNSYLAVKGLLTYTLCGIDLHSKGIKREQSILIQSAIKWLEEFIKKPSEDYFSMLVMAKERAMAKERIEGVSGNLRKDLLAFLEKILLILTDKEECSEAGYDKIYNDLKALLDELTFLNREVEEKILARYRNRASYKV